MNHERDPFRPTPETGLEQLRLMTEVIHLYDFMDDRGNVPQAVQEDVGLNHQTATYEMAMPLAVSTTLHKVEHAETKNGDPAMKIMWLGRTAVENAVAGSSYYWSEAGQTRGDVEVRSADYEERNLRAGYALPFVSPKMTAHDGNSEIAKSEHVYEDDSLRVSYAVTDETGKVVARRLESLLVRDIPFDAWVSMLKDPSNLFGKAFDLHDERSALSVMELFNQLEIPEEAIPEGPITLVEAVLPHVTDPVAKQSVERQLLGFRENQSRYEKQAKASAKEWLSFDMELARSLRNPEKRATFEVQRFIVGLQHEWGEDDLQIIHGHQEDNAQFRMSWELAEVLERAFQNVLNSKAALATDNPYLIAQKDARTIEAIQTDIAYIDIARANGASEAALRRMEASLYRRIAQQNFKVGGGCPGENQGKFNTGPNSPIDSLASAAQRPGDSLQSEKEEEDNSWKDKSSWKPGICKVESCPTRPGSTKVGPCSVCARCQDKFDAGEDPTKEATPSPAPQKSAAPHYDLIEAWKAVSEQKRTEHAPKLAQVALSN